jgi:hypothetical protein
MPIKYQNKMLCLCRACGKTTPREDWEFSGVQRLHICPNCGVVQDTSVSNAYPLGIPVDITSSPPAPLVKKPAKKKT